MNKNWKRSLLVGIAIISLALSACGGGGSGGGTTGETTDPVYITGQFIDSAVSGLIYKCSSGDSGITTTAAEGTLGEFTCQEGDTVDFFVGSYSIGSATAKKYITPYDLYPDNDTAAFNVAQLLQTLDSDGYPSNGITIPEDLPATLGGILVRPGDSNFATAMTDELGKMGKILVSQKDAQIHLETSYEKLPKEALSFGPYITSNSFYFIMNRNSESGNDDLVNVYASLPRGLDFSDIESIQLNNADNQILATSDFDSFTNLRNYYRCPSDSCSFDRHIDNYYWKRAGTITSSGDYTFTIILTTGEERSQVIHYPGPVNIPFISSTSIDVSVLENGDISVAWVNPTTQENWNHVDHILVELRPEDNNSRKRLQLVLDPDNESATIPFDTITSVFNEGEIYNYLELSIMTDARDNDGYPYARGASNNVYFIPDQQGMNMNDDLDGDGTPDLLAGGYTQIFRGLVAGEQFDIPDFSTKGIDSINISFSTIHNTYSLQGTQGYNETGTYSFLNRPDRPRTLVLKSDDAESLFPRIQVRLNGVQEHRPFNVRMIFFDDPDGKPESERKDLWIGSIFWD